MTPEQDSLRYLTTVVYAGKLSNSYNSARPDDKTRRQMMEASLRDVLELSQIVSDYEAEQAQAEV
jgi:hypothetical protein